MKPTSRQAAKQAAHLGDTAFQSPPMSPGGYVYTPSAPNAISYKPGERKGATNEESTENQEGWLISTDREVIIPEMTVRSLVQQTHEAPHLAKLSYMNCCEDIWCFWGCQHWPNKLAKPVYSVLKIISGRDPKPHNDTKTPPLDVLIIWKWRCGLYWCAIQKRALILAGYGVLLFRLSRSIFYRHTELTWNLDAW